MKHLIKYCIYLFIPFHLTGCNIINNEIDDSINENIEFRLDILPSNEIRFESETSRTTVTVLSSHKWEINDTPKWISVNPSAGIDTTQVTISVTENKASEERSEKLLIKSDVEANWIHVYQSAVCDSEIDSDEVKMIFSLEYIEGSYSFLCNDGHHIIVTPEPSLGPTVYVGSLDMNDGSILKNESVMIQCDLEMRPIHVYYDSVNYFIQYKEDTFDLYILDDLDNEEVYYNIQYNKLQITKASTEGMTNLDRAGICLDIVSIALEYKNAGKSAVIKEIEKLITNKVASWSLDPVTEDIIELGLNVADIYIGNSKLAITGAVISYGQLLKECALFMTKRYIGDISPIIHSAVQTSIYGARVNYSLII